MALSRNGASPAPAALLSGLDYLDRGWAVIDLPFQEKNPDRRGWQRERLTRADLQARLSLGPKNISVLLGEASDGLIDVDLDCPEARTLASCFLPATGSVFGRISSPRSHHLFRVAPAPKTQKFRDPLKNNVGAMIVELRSTGCQTVFPGSTHPSGEPVEWAADGRPAGVSAQTC